MTTDNDELVPGATENMIRDLCDTAMEAGAMYLLKHSDDVYKYIEPFINECRKMFLDRFPEMMEDFRRAAELNMPKIADSIIRSSAASIGVLAAKGCINHGEATK